MWLRNHLCGCEQGAIPLWALKRHPQKGRRDPHLGRGAAGWVLCEKALLLAALGPGPEWLLREVRAAQGPS